MCSCLFSLVLSSSYIIYRSQGSGWTFVKLQIKYWTSEQSWLYAFNASSKVIYLVLTCAYNVQYMYMFMCLMYARTYMCTCIHEYQYLCRWCYLLHVHVYVYTFVQYIVPTCVAMMSFTFVLLNSAIVVVDEHMITWATLYMYIHVYTHMYTHYTFMYSTCVYVCSTCTCLTWLSVVQRGSLWSHWTPPWSWCQPQYPVRQQWWHTPYTSLLEGTRWRGCSSTRETVQYQPPD